MTFAEELTNRQSQWSDIQGHLGYLYAAACKYDTIIELGVRYGHSTAALLAGIESTKGHLWSVDNDSTCEFPEEWKESPLWTFIFGNDLDPAVYSILPQEIDMLFIDTSHTYLQTLHELCQYAPRVKKGGIIACHDTTDRAVTDALNSYCISEKLSWTCYPHSYGLGVIHL